jgi:hypothetical protein
MAKALASPALIQSEIQRWLSSCAGPACRAFIPPLPRPCEGNAAGANWTVDTLPGASAKCVPCIGTAILKVMRDYDLS